MADDDDKDKVIEGLRNEGAALRRKLRDAEGRVSELERGQGDQDKLIADAKAAGAAEAKKELEAKHAGELTSAKVVARAHGFLIKPDDAPRFLDMAGLVGKDDATIDAALKGLVDERPYVGIAKGGNGPGAGKTGTPSGNGDGGARPGGQASTDDQINALLRGGVKH